MIIKKNESKKITGKILGSSILENSKMLDELLELKTRDYKPSIPNLAYQYNFFSNYIADDLNQKNSEIPE